MRMLKLVGSVALAAALVGGAVMVGCGDDGGTTTADARPPTADAGGGAGTATVNFGPVIDTNNVYAAGDLEWKGAMTYNAASNKITPGSAGWTSNMWAPLYDDGPPPAGHEAAGQTAGDHKWSVQVLIDKPATGEITVEYGLNDKSYRLAGGDGWLWPPGPNGTFKVMSTSTAVNAAGFTTPAFGAIDLRITIDTTMLAGRPATDAGTAQTWDTSMVKIKASWWSWGTTTLTKDAQGKAVLVLSSVVGAGKQFNHTGLLPTGTKVEFVPVFGNDEYVIGNVAKMGVTAEYKPSGGAFTALPILGGDANSKNTYVMIP